MFKAGKLDVSIVRYFNIYGPRQTPILVVSQNIHKVLNGRKPIIYDGGLQTRCFTYVKDAIDATIKVAESDSTSGEIFNIGSNIETNILSLLNMICEVCNVNPSFKELDTSLHYGESYQDISRRVPEVSKIYDFIGWKIETSLFEGIEHTVGWAKNNKEWLSLPNE
jgi:UDP-glucose 4-epimerase